MDSLNLWWFHGLGFYIGELRATLATDEKLSSSRYPATVQYASDVLGHLIKYDRPIFPKSKEAAVELMGAIIKFANVGNPDRRPTEPEWRPLIDAIDKFHHVVEQEMLDSHIYVVTQVGAYSVDSLIENAEVHLSSLAQECVSEQEKRDCRLAGVCLALDLFTASGFHSMRFLEAGARTYHRLITGVDMSDVPWGALINGDKKYPDSGLVKTFEAEGSHNDSKLGLIISLLSSINKIYRCPIVHPEMTLTKDSAKLVFDLSALAFSAMIEDAAERFAAKQASNQATAGVP